MSGKCTPDFKIPTLLLFLLLGGLAHFSSGQNPVVRVSGIPYSINGQDSIPIGLFGVHSTDLTTERLADWGIELVRGIEAGPSGSPSYPGKNNTFPAGIKRTIDCYYDRYQPALYLSNRNGWKTQLENLATSYGNASLAMGHRPFMEFWNEPFLNWASKPGTNYDNRWYDSTSAVLGGPVRRPGFTEPEKHLVWDRKKWFVQLSPTVTDPVNFFVLIGNNWTALNNLSVGQELMLGSKRVKAVMAWLPKDTTQKSYFSSLANAEMYNKMYRVYAQKLKSVNPNQRIAAGWGMQIHQENWRPWYTEYKPTLDSCWQWMDGIHEHHYGGDTRFISAGYEVANAYSQVKYGKKMPMLNTEAGGFLDPQIPGNVVPGQPSDPLLRDRGAFQYTFREIVGHISKCPDKAYSRAAHEAHLNKGDGMAFRLLRDLRGKLISSSSSSDNVWVVSSLNGTKLVVAVYNDNSVAQQVELSVRAPKGFQFTGGQGRLVKDSSSGTTIAVEYENFPASDTLWNRTVSIAQKSGRSFTLDLTGSLTETPMVINQYFADTVLANVPASGELNLKMEIPAGTLATAKSARLKLILRNFSGGNLLVNGQPVGLVSNGFFTYLPIDKDLLQPTNTLRFSAGTSAFDFWIASMEILSGNLDSSLLVTSSRLVSTKEIPLVFPNPGTRFVTLTSMEDASDLSLSDMTGRVFPVRLVSDGMVELLDISALSTGVYQLRFRKGQKWQSLRICRE
jgi:hypothetical protein